MNGFRGTFGIGVMIWLGWIAGVESADGQPLSGVIAYNKPNSSVNIGGQDVWLANSDGTRDHPVPLITNSLVTAEFPVWSRDGRLIAATGVLAGGNPTNSNVFVFEPTGANLRQASFLDVPGRTFEALFKAFSPDGSRLAFVAFADVPPCDPFSGVPPCSPYFGTEVVLIVQPLGLREFTIVDGGVLDGSGWPWFWR